MHLDKVKFMPRKLKIDIEERALQKKTKQCVVEGFVLFHIHFLNKNARLD